jgi:hypothetical protein
MLILLGLIILTLLLVAIFMRLFPTKRNNVALQLWTKRTTQPPAPFEELQASPDATAAGYRTYERAALQEIYSTFDSGAYQSAALTDDMLNCYRRRSSDDICVPNILGSTCMSCQDHEDPPGSGCFAGDETCRNNYSQARSGGTKSPVETYPVSYTTATALDGFISGLCVKAYSAKTLTYIGEYKSDNSGNFALPEALGLVVLESTACNDGSTPIDMTTEVAYEGTLKSVVDTTQGTPPVMSPLTTLVAELTVDALQTAIDSSSEVDASTVSALLDTHTTAIANNFGISKVQLSRDYLTDVDGDATGAAMQVAAIDKLLNGVSGRITGSNTSKILAQRIAASGGTFDLSDEATVESLATAILVDTGVDATEAASLATLATSGIANVARVIQTSTDMDDVSAVIKFSELNKKVSQAAQDETGTLAFTSLTDADIDTSVGGSGIRASYAWDFRAAASPGSDVVGLFPAAELEFSVVDEASVVENWEDIYTSTSRGLVLNEGGGEKQEELKIYNLQNVKAIELVATYIGEDTAGNGTILSITLGARWWTLKVTSDGRFYLGKSNQVFWWNDFIPGTTYHIVWTEREVYFNGTRRVLATDDTILWDNDNSYLVLGQQGGRPTDPRIRGAIVDIESLKVYNQELSAGDAQGLYTAYLSA